MKKLIFAVGFGLAMIFGAGGAMAIPILVSATNSTGGSADRSTLTRTVTIGTSGTILDVNISIDWSKCDDPLTAAFFCGGGGGFIFPTEAFASLSGPGGTTVVLFPAGHFTGPSGNVDVSQTFDDGAAVLPATIMSGTFSPTGTLTAFNGLSAPGIYTLSIGDTVGADPLGFRSFTLDITLEPRGGNQIPEPATLAIFGLGLLGLGVVRRRRKVY